MAVVAEIWCRPTRFQRWWCSLIGFNPPTCGLLRGGPLLDDSGRSMPFEVACGFLATDHIHAELKALPAKSLVPSDVKDAISTLADCGLVAWFRRRSGDGAERKQWRSNKMSKIHNPNHPHHLPPIPAGYVIEPSDPFHLKSVDLHAKGHLTFTVLSETSVSDDEDVIVISRKHKG